MKPKKIYHFIYKTTNLITNEWYIGAHSTKNLFDGYMGSGLLLKKAVKHYGKENFETIMIKECHSSQDKWIWERKIIDVDVVCDPMSYNLQSGGKRRSKNTYTADVRTKKCFAVFY